VALAGALCHTLLAATGFTDKHLRVLMTGLLGDPHYTTGQMTYDLRRLRLTGLIRRLLHTNRYLLTGDGIRVAVFYTKVYNRLLVPLTAADQPQAPPSRRPQDHHRLRRRLRSTGPASPGIVKLDTNVHNLATKDVR
jgi:hypothetical protein